MSASAAGLIKNIAKFNRSLDRLISKENKDSIQNKERSYSLYLYLYYACRFRIAIYRFDIDMSEMHNKIVTYELYTKYAKDSRKILNEAFEHVMDLIFALTKISPEIIYMVELIRHEKQRIINGL